MGRKGLICSFTLILFLDSVSSGPKREPKPIRELNTILDLREIDFGHSFPRRGFVLLYWFGNNIIIDNNGIIRLNFEPNRGDYGIHCYSNYEGLLEVLPARRRIQTGNRPIWESYSYYTLGNIHHNNNARVLPSYVTQSVYNSGGNSDSNRDRIIFRTHQVDYLNGEIHRTIDRVYFTQHYRGQSTTYDPDNTYRSTTNLLREIQALSQRDIRSITPGEIREHYNSDVDLTFLNYLRNCWGNLSNLGLLLVIVLSSHDARKFGKHVLFLYWLGDRGAGAVSHGDDKDDDDILLMKLEVKTTSKGKARICWSDVPSRFLKQCLVVLYKNNEDDKSSIYTSVDCQDGFFDTPVPLNPGLQVRLHNATSTMFGWGSPVGEEIWRGPEFHDANGKQPVYIPGHDASLQLFVKDGMACARLYVRKTFDDWTTKFYNSWVGFYSDEMEPTSGFNTWQWATHFTRENRSDLADIPDYDIFVYHSKMAIAPEVQVQFILQKNDKSPLVRTPPWIPLKLEVKTTSKGKARICWSDFPSRFLNQCLVVLYKNNEDNKSSIYTSVDCQDGFFDTSVPLNPGLQVRLHTPNSCMSSWFTGPVGKEIRRGPEFHDANGKQPVYIPDHDASLQLFVKDGMACARLYVRKTFTDWKIKFGTSWVGFYLDEMKPTSGHNTWQWAVNFTWENCSDCADYDIFVYHSKMVIAPGVQVRFILKNNVSLVHTPPWDHLMPGTK